MAAASSLLSPSKLSEELWAEAYATLKAEQPKIVGAYERHLLPDEQQAFSADKAANVLRQLLDQREQRKLVVSILGKPLRVREQGEKIVRFIIWSKDIIASTVSSEPHVALAWGGVCLLLPLLLNPVQQNDAMLGGLATVTNLIRLYRVREDIYIAPSASSKPTQSYNVGLFRSSVVQLYTNILEYQVRVVCHLSHTQVSRAIRSTLKKDSWIESLQQITTCDVNCAELIKIVDKEAENLAFAQQSSELERSTQIQQQNLDIVTTLQKEQQDSQRSSKRRKLMESLSSRQEQFKNLNPTRVPGTCQWFLDDKRLRDWRDSTSSRLLWISADPGCGKSVLLRTLIDEGHLANGLLGASVCHFFFKVKQDAQSLWSQALKSILHQVLCKVQDGPAIDQALSAYENHGDSLADMSSELWKLLLHAAEDPQVGQIICAIDAVDECEPKTKTEILDCLVKYFGSSKSREPSAGVLKFVVTSRPYHDIQSSFDRLEGNAGYIHFDGQQEGANISLDIERVIDARVREITHKRLSENEQEEVADLLKAKGNRTYLWLYLMFDEFKKRVFSLGTVKRIQQMTQKLPESIEDAYNEILSTSPEPEIALRILEIIIAAGRPLRLSEVNAALTFALEDWSCSSLDEIDFESDDSFSQNVKNICGLFVTIYEGSLYLIHQTAREFLLTEAPNKTFRWRHSIQLEAAHATIAKACMLSFFLAVPSMEHVGKPAELTDTVNERDLTEKTFKLTSVAQIEKHALLLYSSIYWAEHVQLMGSQCQGPALSAATRLCHSDDRPYWIWTTVRVSILVHGGARYKLDLHKQLPIFPKTGPFLSSQLPASLFTASWLGLIKVVALLLESEEHPGAEVDTYHMSLRVGIKGTFAILGRDGNIWGYPSTALVEATSRGFPGIVRLLLQAGVSTTDSYADQALLAVCEQGNVETARELLKCYAEVDPNFLGRSREIGRALETAIPYGHYAIVEMLLDHGARTTGIPASGRTSSAIAEAARFGQEEIARLLLRRGAKEHRLDIIHALSLAVEQSAHEKFARVADLLVKVAFELGLQHAEYTEEITIWVHETNCDDALAHAITTRRRDVLEILVRPGLPLGSADLLAEITRVQKEGFTDEGIEKLSKFLKKNEWGKRFRWSYVSTRSIIPDAYELLNV